jgi:enoyl-CoA hydratase
MPYTTLTLTTHKQTATITLNRPEVLNALNAAMFDDLEQAFTLLAADPTIRAIIVTGSGERAFAAGADIRGLVSTDATSGLAVSQRGQQVFSQIETCGKPTIAAINGVALGGGCELALACTLRLASTTARLGLPELKLGLIPGYGGTLRLTRLIGRGQALRMMLTAAIIDAPEAQRLGLVEEILPAADLLPRASALAATIAQLSPLGVAGALEALNRSENLAPTEALAIEAEIFGRLCGSADKHEGLTAFLEKRTPTWRNE